MSNDPTVNHLRHRFMNQFNFSVEKHGVMPLPAELLIRNRFDKAVAAASTALEAQKCALDLQRDLDLIRRPPVDRRPKKPTDKNQILLF